MKNSLKSTSSKLNALGLARYKNKKITYICDAISILREVIPLLKVSQDIEEFLLDVIEKSQLYANKMEDGLIEKNYLLIEEGYSKCVHCKSWGKLTYDEVGYYHKCCGMPYS
jgi:hypothetical protein